VKVSELADESGVPVATIKYYLREGIIPAGVSAGMRRAEYGAIHLRRLRLVRVLRDVCQVPIAGITALVRAVDDDTVSEPQRFEQVQSAVTPAQGEVTEADRRLGSELVEQFGWVVDPANPALAALGHLVATIRSLPEFRLPSDLRPWADAAMTVAKAEVAAVPQDATPAERAEHVALGTALSAQLLAQLCVLAEQSARAALPDLPVKRRRRPR
jgi:DNA-binding transcriptional MerR regulator